MNDKKKRVIKPKSTKSNKLSAKVPNPPPAGHRDSISLGHAKGDTKKGIPRGKASASVRLESQKPTKKSNPSQIEYFKDIVGTIREPLLVLGADLRVLSANRSFYQFFKVKQKETVGVLLYNLGNRQWDIPALRLLLETILPQKAVFNDYKVEHDFPVIGRRILLLNARRIPAPPKEAQWILLAFEDVTERMRLEGILQASEKRFHEAFETASDSMLLVDKISGQVLNSNRAAQDSFSYSSKELLKKNLWELGILKDRRQFKRISIKLEEQGVVGLVDTTIPTGQGGHFPADLTMMDRAEVIQCNIRDTTKRKRVEEELSASEEKFRTIAEQMTEMIYLTDEGGIIKYVSPAVEPIFGYTLTEMLGHHFTDFLAEDDIPKAVAAFSLTRTKKETSRNLELSMKRKDGSLFTGELNGALYRRGDIITGTIGFIRDITERKRTEEALRESEERYRLLLEFSPDAITVHSDGKFVYVNPAAVRMYGAANSQELLGKPLLDRVHPDYRKFVKERVQRLYKGKGAVLLEEKILQLDGTEIEVEVAAIPFIYKGKPAAQMVARDISERKRAEEAMRESEHKVSEALEFNRKILETTSIGILTFKESGQCVSANAAVARITGGTMAQHLAQNFHEIQPWKKPGIYQAAIRALDTGIEQSLEAHIVTTFGKDAWLSFSFTRFDSAGERHLLVFAYDITERKQAEQAQRAAEANYRALIEQIPAVTYMDIADGSAQSTFVSPQIESILGVSQQEWVQGDMAFWKKLIHPDDQQRVLAAYQHTIKTGQPFNEQYRMFARDGRMVWIDDNAVLLESASGQPNVLQGVMFDVTDSKHAEEALSASEERYKSLVETQSDIIARSDLDGRLTFVNDAYCKAFGKTHEELLGKIFTPTVFPEDIPTVSAAIKLIQTPPYHMQTETRHLTPSGMRWFSWDNAAVMDKSGKIRELQGIGRDITDRKQVEESLLRSQQELAHANHLLLALSRAAQAVQRVHTQKDVYEAIQEQMTQLGYKATVFELDDEGKDLRIAYLNYASNLVRKAEKMTGLSMRDYRIQPRRGSVYQRVLEQGETVHVEDDALAVADAIPKKLRLLARPVVELLHLQPSTFAPLLVGDETIGVFSVTGLELTEADNPAITAFARQAAIALQNARLYEQAQQEISERKQVEERIQQLNATLEQRVEHRTRELREAQEQLVRNEKLAVLGQLAGSVGHELRNPLSVINTSIYFLKLAQSDADWKIKEHHAMIEQEVQNADKIIGDLLDFARVVSSDRKPVSVDGLVRQTLERFPVPARVELTLELPDDLPDVFADPRQVEQVLGNLTVNACQAMAPTTEMISQESTGTPSPQTGSVRALAGGGKLTISAAVQKDLASAPPSADTADGGLLPDGSASRMPPRLVAIAVKDTGVGITPENMKKLFEPLFTTKAKGIGLGLAVSRKLAEANGGRIEVESEPGKGSTFTLWLPVIANA